MKYRHVPLAERVLLLVTGARAAHAAPRPSRTHAPALHHLPRRRASRGERAALTPQKQPEHP
eukprot:2193572-Pleurochrysis_carterae.AAC.1